MLRLLSLFEPYTYLKPRIEEALHRPIDVSTAKSRSGRPFVVRICARLFNEASPDWLEYSLLSYCRSFVYHFDRRALDPAAEAGRAANITRLHEFYESLQLPAPPSIAATEIAAPLGTAPKPGERLDEIWSRLARTFFPDHPEIPLFRIRWSARSQRNCLGSCNVEARTVNIAKVLDNPEYYRLLEPLIYHEMCHAALGKPRVVNGRRQMHGRDFKALERRHPGIAELDRWIASGGWHAAVRKARRASGAQHRRSTLGIRRSRS